MIQEDQSGCAKYATVSDLSLGNNRNFAAKHSAGGLRNTPAQWFQQLLTRGHDVSANDKHFWVEDVKQTYDTGNQRPDRTIEHTNSALVTVRCCTKDCFSVRSLAFFGESQGMFRSSMHMSEIVRFDRARREARFEATVVATNAETAADVDGHVAEVACNPRGTMQDHPVNHGSAAHARAQRQQHHIATAASSTPQDFRQQRGSRIIVDSNREIFDSDQIFEQRSFQKLQNTRNVVDARRCRIDNPATANAYSCYLRFGFIETGMNEILKVFAALRRWATPAFKHLSVAADNPGFDAGCADIETESGRETRRIRLVRIHNEFALYRSMNRDLAAIRW
jgi:hypothetical protein